MTAQREVKMFQPHKKTIDTRYVVIPIITSVLFILWIILANIHPTTDYIGIDKTCIVHGVHRDNVFSGKSVENDSHAIVFYRMILNVKDTNKLLTVERYYPTQSDPGFYSGQILTCHYKGSDVVFHVN